MPTSSSEKKPKLTAATCAVVISLLGIAAMAGSPPFPPLRTESAPASAFPMHAAGTWVSLTPYVGSTVVLHGAASLHCY